MDSEFTRKFQVVQDRNEEMRATLMAVYDALKEKGYNPINQIVGYIFQDLRRAHRRDRDALAVH